MIALYAESTGVSLEPGRIAEFDWADGVLTPASLRHNKLWLRPLRVSAGPFPRIGFSNRPVQPRAVSHCRYRDHNEVRGKANGD